MVTGRGWSGRRRCDDLARDPSTTAAGAADPVGRSPVIRGLQQQPALSPDGSQIAFVWDGESGNNRDIYITMTAGGSPRRITTDAGADDYPAWSPTTDP